MNLTLRAVLAALAVIAVWTLVVLLTIRDDLEQAQNSLERARTADDAPSALSHLEAAERDLSRASGQLDQPGPVLAGSLPLLGRTVRAISRSADAALAVTQGGKAVLVAAETGGPVLVDGRVDLGRLQDIGRALESAAIGTRAPVAALRRQPLGLVPDAVAVPARAAQVELADVPADFASASAALRGLRDVLGAEGPQDLLVLLENNAELRGTGGIVTVFAQATAVDGTVDVRDFQDVEDVADRADSARVVPAPADYEALYGPYKANTTLWKNTNMSPDVPTSSRVMANVAAASTGRRPDVVLWLDVPAIAALLRATGPAELPDGTLLRAEDTVPTLLSTAYRDAPDTPAGQAQRRAALRGAADAVISRLLGDAAATTSPASLARELLAAARGRHLALWSANPSTQADLRAAELDGGITAGDGDLSAFTVHNLGGGDADGNKLDFYGRRQTTVRAVVDRDAALVEQEVALRNTAPESGLPLYVAGRVTPGVSNSLVTMALPPGAEVLASTRDGRPWPGSFSPAGDHVVLTDVVAIPPGATTTWRVRYRLPLEDGRYGLTLYPQPLAVDSGLLVEVRPADGLVLEPADGSRPEDGLRLSGPFSAVTRVGAIAAHPPWPQRWQAAVRHFWNEPVRLP